MEDILRNVRKVWISDDESVAVYLSSSSGPTKYSVVTRYTLGLKEKETNFHKPFRERYEGVNGQNSNTDYLDIVRIMKKMSGADYFFIVLSLVQNNRIDRILKNKYI